MNNPWKDISIPENDVLSRRVNSEHPLELFWARDQYGRYLFIYELQLSENIPHKFPLLSGIDIKYLQRDPENEREYLLLLILKEKKDWQIFRSLCQDIISVTKNCKRDKSAFIVILRRLNKWQEFLKKARSEILPERVIKGLLGELIFLKNHLEPIFGIGQAIKFWQGPDDKPQDFSVSDCGIEVKCQLGATKPYVRITSAEQLCPQLPKMFLYVVTLGNSTKDLTEALNLPKLIGLLRNKLEAVSFDDLEYFNNLIYQTGYIDNLEYEEFSYIIVSESIYAVIDDFPRICPDDLPSGISKLTYDIDLNECEPLKNMPDWSNPA